MANESRTRVRDFVVGTPGMSVRAISRAVALDETTVSYHLRRLERDAKLAAEPRGRELLWFPVGHGLCPVLRQAIPLLRREALRTVAHALDDLPASAAQLAARTGMEERPVRTACAQLERAGLVQRTVVGRVLLRDGAETCVAKAADEEPCGRWGECPVSRAWMRREVEARLESVGPSTNTIKKRLAP